MSRRFLIRLFVSGVLSLIIAYVFPLIRYSPTSSWNEISQYVLILLCIGAIISKFMRIKRKR